MKAEFFYSKSTGLYVARKALKIDSRVNKAAEKSKVEMEWDDEGRINFIDFDNSKKLLTALGSSMLSPVDYWKVLKDAEKAKDKDMLEDLTSDRYCEWLDRVYLDEKTFIDHPKIEGRYRYSGKVKRASGPYGKPGWFNPENNIDYELGVPKKVELFREKFATSWKFWSPSFSTITVKATAPIRGYVTSVGKPSFDLGIPVNSRQPMQMVRECRRVPLEPPIPVKILTKASELLDLYLDLGQNIRNKNGYRPVQEGWKPSIDFILEHGKLFRRSKELEVYKARENFFNLLGLLKTSFFSKNQTQKIAKIDKAGLILSEIKERKLNYKDFSDFIQTSKARLRQALKERKDVVFVMGHKNPDSDTVVSSLLEAWRNHLLDRGGVAYIPIVQNYKIPDEVRYLLGDNLFDYILLDKEKIYGEAKKSGLARWISVDQNREPKVQKYFVSIIDHHVVSEVANSQDIVKTLEMAGSCTALITQKILGMGLYPDKKLARILYGATLMDTENRVSHKMTPKDSLTMDYLKSASGIANDDKYYGDLMSFLLNTDDPEILFRRDYKEDWGFGFAVAKIKAGFGKNGQTLKEKLMRKAIALAKQNNVDKNLPLTVLRITDYEDDNITVNRERVFLIFNKGGSKEFIETTFDLLIKIVRFEFGKVNVRKTKEFVEFWGTGMQLSRKKTAPVLEPVVKAFNEYFYSPTVKIWTRRDFLKKTHDVTKAADKLKIKISTDKENRINYITYPEAKALVDELDYSILSLKEYWLVLNDAKKIKDIQMVESLQGSNFVEFLDTIIKDHGYVIEHPQVTKRGGKHQVKGKGEKVKIPEGRPGLIHPDEIDLATGIPKKVRDPNEYGNPELWRYWEPDAELVIPTRSYIFLLKQPCWDGKFHIADSFPNLGIRPCCQKRTFPQVKMSFSREKLNIRIEKEGDVIDYFWAR